MQPGNSSFDKPSSGTQAAAMFGFSLGEDRRDTQPTQEYAKRLGIVATVALDALRKLPLRPRFAADRRHVDEYVEQLCHVVDIGGSRGRIQRNAVSVGHHMMLAA